MAYRKVKDLAVVTGTYESNGETKKRWRNVGIVMKGDDGNSFILLDRAFNPAGVPFKEGTDQIAIGVFDLRDEQEQAQTAPSRPAPSQTRPPRQPEDDDIPF